MAKRRMPQKDIVEKEVVENLSSEHVSNKFEKPANYVVANCQRLNVREKPEKNSKVLSILAVGTPIVIDGMIDDWFHISAIYNGKHEGYVLAQYVREV